MAENTKEFKNVERKKVYIILAIQLISAIALISVFRYIPAINKQIHEDMSLLRIDIICSLIIMFISLICLCFSKSIRTSPPINFVMLGFFTFVINYMFAVVGSDEKPKAIIVALGVAVITFFLATGFAYMMWIDLTPWVDPLIISLIILINLEAVVSFFYSKKVGTIVGIINLILYIVYLIYCTQLIVTKDPLYGYPTEEYVFAAMFIYIVTIYIIFRYILVFSLIVR